MEQLTGNDSRTGAEKFGEELRHHWLVLLILVITASRTFDIFLATAVWWPLAVAGVFVTEGSWFFWNDHIEHAHRDLQRWIAVGAVVVTWATIALTSAADVAW